MDHQVFPFCYTGPRPPPLMLSLHLLPIPKDYQVLGVWVLCPRALNIQYTLSDQSV